MHFRKSILPPLMASLCLTAAAAADGLGEAANDGGQPLAMEAFPVEAPATEGGARSIPEPFALGLGLLGLLLLLIRKRQP